MCDTHVLLAMQSHPFPNAVITSETVEKKFDGFQL